MYINLEREELALLVASLSPLTIEPARVLSDRLQAKIEESLDQTMQQLFQKYRDGADQNYAEEGKIEVDDNALVSIGDEDGAYVMVWHWVSAAAADIADSEDEVDFENDPDTGA